LRLSYQYPAAAIRCSATHFRESFLPESMMEKEDIRPVPPEEIPYELVSSNQKKKDLFLSFHLFIISLFPPFKKPFVHLFLSFSIQ
jgi:hypothetical protein